MASGRTRRTRRTGIGPIGRPGNFRVRMRLVDRFGVDITPSKTAAVWKFDEADRLVGSAIYRGVRAAALKVRKETKKAIGKPLRRKTKPRRSSSKKKKRARGEDRYIKNNLSKPELLAYIARRHAWRKRGSPAGKEPKPPAIPSLQGEPPRKGEQQKLFNSMFAAPAPGVTLAGAKRLRIGQVVFNSGVSKQPLKGPSIVGKRNKGTAPRLHRRGGSGRSTGGKGAKYPKRPYIDPQKARWGNKNELVRRINDELVREGASEERKRLTLRRIGG